jgi:hypothetical protein
VLKTAKLRAYFAFNSQKLETFLLKAKALNEK